MAASGYGGPSLKREGVNWKACALFIATNKALKRHYSTHLESIKIM